MIFFSPIQIIVTELRLKEKIVWFLCYAMNVSIHYCYLVQGTGQDGGSMIKDFGELNKSDFFFMDVR